MLKKTKFAAFAATTILAVLMPGASFAQEQIEGKPMIRERLWTRGAVNAPDVYSWLQTIGNCSTSCGTGERVLSQQCQNISDYAPDGTYGPAEPDAMCVANAGPRPADVTQSCTVLTSCTYDWVKPSVQRTALSTGGNPAGRVGCGYVHEVFSPYCQRNGGPSAVVMAPADHGFCSADRPDYDDVASGNPDALGYDRNVTQVQSCNTSDHEWRTTAWSAWSSTCDTNATSTRTVTCYRKFDNSVQADAACDAVSQPAASRVETQYASCAYSFSYGQWSAWTSGCDTSATRTRSATCMRSNNGGSGVDASECTTRGVAREAVSETAAQYGSCSYAFKTAAWGAWSSSCDSAASRSRDVWCERSNGDRVADGECTSRGEAKPAPSESAARYDTCSYSWGVTSWSGYNSSCSNNAVTTRSVWCRRDLDQATVADSFCDAGTRPVSSNVAGQYGSCTYARGGTPTGWSAWNSTCSSNASRSRTYQCVRSNDGGQVVANSECTSRGVDLTETQNAAVYDSCSYSWAVSSWSGYNSSCSNNAVTTRSVWCRRDSDNTTVADSFCNAGTRPAASQSAGQYGSCTYARGGSATAWSGWNSGCSSNAQRSRTWQCIRSNDGGQAVSATECTNRGINLTETETSAQYGSCSHNWATGGWSGWSSGCSANASRTRSVWCRRDFDGATVSDGLCNGGSRPSSSETSGQYGSCSYSPNYGGWSNCSNSVMTRSMTSCIRSVDGASVPTSECTNRGSPATQSQNCQPGTGAVLRTEQVSGNPSMSGGMNSGSYGQMEEQLRRDFASWCTQYGGSYVDAQILNMGCRDNYGDTECEYTANITCRVY